MKRIKILSILMIVMLFSICNINRVYGLSSTLSPSASSITQGGTFTVRVNFSSDVCAASYNITYDTSKLTLVSGETSEAWTEGEALPSLAFKAKSGVTGTANISISAQVSDTNFVKSNISGGTSVNIGTPVVAKTPTTTTNASASNTNLKKLVPNFEGLSPSFNPAVTKYSLTVPSTTTNLKLTVATEATGSKYWISGDENLKLGDNTVTITVTASNGAKKVYTIIVTKADDVQKANAYLSNLVVDGKTLSPVFAAESLEYDIGTVTSDVDKLTVLAYTQKEGAKSEITGNESLKDGENIIKIKVTAEDGVTTKEYTIKVTKEATAVATTDEVAIYSELNNLQNLGGTTPPTSLAHTLWMYLKKFWLVLALFAFCLFELGQIIFLYKKVNKGENKEVKSKIKIKEIKNKIVLDDKVNDEIPHRRRNSELTRSNEESSKNIEVKQDKVNESEVEEKVDDTYEEVVEDYTENGKDNEDFTDNFDIDESNKK